VLGCGDHGLGGGEVVYRVVWEAGCFVGGPDGAHGTSKRGVRLFFATVVVD
jgi:hypothetical protein